MSDDEYLFKLTFNKPAEMSFFGGDDVIGVQIRVTDGIVYFRASVDENDDGLLPIERRTRGGYESVVEGTHAAFLLDTFKAAGGSHLLPFFTLSRARGGWVKAEHFAENTAPPKFEPHVRVWAPRERHEESPVPELNEEIVAALGDFADRVFRAQSVLKEHTEARKVGRPPREVREAERVLEAFELMVQKVGSDRRPERIADVRMVQEARDLLTAVLQKHETASTMLAFSEAPEQIVDEPVIPTPPAPPPVVVEPAKKKEVTVLKVVEGVSGLAKKRGRPTKEEAATKLAAQSVETKTAPVQPSMLPPDEMHEPERVATPTPEQPEPDAEPEPTITVSELERVTDPDFLIHDDGEAPAGDAELVSEAGAEIGEEPEIEEGRFARAVRSAPKPKPKIGRGIGKKQLRRAW